MSVFSQAAVWIDALLRLVATAMFDSHCGKKQNVDWESRQRNGGSLRTLTAKFA
jgi:hypothetical protein